jgi:hypothetical protein
MPERISPIYQTIPIGEQRMILPNGANPDLTDQEIDLIIGQNVKYGLIKVEDLDSCKVFHGLCYSVGKPISADKMNRGARKNEETHTARGKQSRIEAALGINYDYENKYNASVRRLEMEFKEEEPRGGYQENLTHIHENVTVTPSEQAPPGVQVLRRK